MKHLRFGFAFIIAILAVTLTIAAQAGVFENNQTPLPDCFKPGPTSTTPIVYDDNANCSNVQFAQFLGQDDCDDADVLNSLGKNIFGGLSAAAEDIITDEEIAEACPNGDFVCCVFVQEATVPCDDTAPQEQQLINLDGSGAKYWEIVDVRCRTAIIP